MSNLLHTCNESLHIVVFMQVFGNRLKSFFEYGVYRTNPLLIDSNNALISLIVVAFLCLLL